MKEKETDYLNKLFATSSDVNDEVEVEVPLLEVSDQLSDKLYAIAGTAAVAEPAENTVLAKRGIFKRWPAVSSIAAGLMVAFIGLQFYQQQQTLRQLEQAQSDLATALHYLGEANRIARDQVRDSVNENINKAGVVPAINIGRGVVNPRFEQYDSKPNTPNRTL